MRTRNAAHVPTGTTLLFHRAKEAAETLARLKWPISGSQAEELDDFHLELSREALDIRDYVERNLRDHFQPYWFDHVAGVGWLRLADDFGHNLRNTEALSAYLGSQTKKKTAVFSRRANRYHDVGFTETGRWGNVGSGPLFTTGEKILLLQRSPYVEEPGVWGIPGSAVPQTTEGEFCDPYASTRQETQEEIGSVPIHTVVDQYRYEEPGFRYDTFVAQVDPFFGIGIPANLDVANDPAEHNHVERNVTRNDRDSDQRSTGSAGSFDRHQHGNGSNHDGTTGQDLNHYRGRGRTMDHFTKAQKRNRRPVGFRKTAQESPDEFEMTETVEDSPGTNWRELYLQPIIQMIRSKFDLEPGTVKLLSPRKEVPFETDSYGFNIVGHVWFEQSVPGVQEFGRPPYRFTVYISPDGTLIEPVEITGS